MANLKDTIVLGNLTVTGSVTASSILGSSNSATSADYPTGFASRPSSITWGTLAESASYVTRWDDPSGGSVAFGHSCGKTSMQIDGYYYQEEGAYQVLDNRYMWNHIVTPNGSAAATGMVYVNTRMAIKGNGASYNEGLRILPASNGWSNIFFSGDDSLYNTHSGGWLLGRRGAAGSYGDTGDFTIENNGSNGNGLTLYANGSRPRWNGNELAYKSDCKNPTDYYWANIKVSDSSSTSTRPTFKAAYAETLGVERIQPWDQSGVIEIGDPELSDSSAPGEIRISAYDGITLTTGPINHDSDITFNIGHDGSSYMGYVICNGPTIFKDEVRFKQDSKAYFSTNGYLTWRSDGIEMSGDDSYGKIYPKTTNCGYLGKSNLAWYYGYINNVKGNSIFADNICNKNSSNNTGSLGSSTAKWQVLWTQYINAYQIRSLSSATATSVSAGGSIGSTNLPFGYGYFTNLYKGGSSVSTSDIRLKNDVKQTDLQALSIVNNLHILNYQLNSFTKEQNDLKKRKQKAIATMKELPKTKENRALRKQLQELISKPNNQNTLDIGVSAQELEQLLPAKYRNTFILKESTEEFADQRFIKDDNLIYLALKAIQEQQQIINNLQNQIKELMECIHN